MTERNLDLGRYVHVFVGEGSGVPFTPACSCGWTEKLDPGRVITRERARYIWYSDHAKGHLSDVYGEPDGT